MAGECEAGTMSTEPEAVVRSYYEHVDAEEYEALFDLFADDVRYVRPGQDAIEGMESFEAFYREDRPLDEGRHEIDDVAVDGDTVAVRGRFHGVQNGGRVSFGFADFHRFDDEGRIAKRWTYTDRDTV